MTAHRDKALLSKLMVSLSRKWGRTNRHTPLKEQLSVNRGKALSYPKEAAPTRQARKAADKRQRLKGIF